MEQLSMLDVLCPPPVPEPSLRSGFRIAQNEAGPRRPLWQEIGKACSCFGHDSHPTHGGTTA